MRGNPAGILMIGVGVVLLNLAYSGRGVAVWKAITGGSTGDAAAPDDAKSADKTPDATIRPSDANSTPTGGVGGDGPPPAWHLWGIHADDLGTTWGVIL